MQVAVYNTAGEVADKIEISDDVFGVGWREGVVHQAMVRQLANRRLGMHDTKTRSTVSGSGKKLYQQKHTGRARRGDITSPTLKGGAVAFGPHPRSYRQAMPKKMRRLAIRCALSSKIADGELKILQGLSLENGKTKELAHVLENLGSNGTVLVATAEVDPVVIQAARNIPGVKTTPAALLNVLDLLRHRSVLMTVDAVRKAEALWQPKKTEAQKQEEPEKQEESKKQVEEATVAEKKPRKRASTRSKPE
ncbi:MAG: 50S ribosomal protein L4 [Chloroflexi bacterium]|nr:50S ribosomal protein L4 [Chloroflexota bacterium]